MGKIIDSVWKQVLCLGLAALALGGTAWAEEPGGVRVIGPRGTVVDLQGCPEVEVSGSSIRVLSASNRGFLGVEATSLTPELRQHFGVTDAGGIMLSRVLPDSAAQAAGLLVGDIVSRVDDEDINSSGELGHAIRRKEGGETVEIEYWRDGERRTATATLEEQERCAFDLGEYIDVIQLDELPKRLEAMKIEIDPDTLRDAMKNAREVLRDQDWDKYLQGIRVPDLEGMEERMELLQERLEELEKRLDGERSRLGKESSERGGGGGGASRI